MKDVKALKLAVRGSGLTQSKLAEKIGLSRQSVNDWLNKRDIPDELLYKICEVINRNPKDFIEEEDDENNEIEINNITLNHKIKDNIGKILVELRKELDINQKDLANKLGVKQGTISNWERNERTPDHKNLIKLSKILNKPLSFFIEGDVENDSTNTNSDINKIETIDDALKDELISVELPKDYIKVRLSTSVKAGEDTLLIQNGDDYEDVPSIVFPNYVRNWTQKQIDSKYQAVKVQGDSMYPEYKPGDILVLEKDFDIISGKEYIVSIDNHIIVKTIYKQNGNIMLVSVNDKNYKTKILSENFIKQHDVRIEHRVIYLMRDYR